MYDQIYDFGCPEAYLFPFLEEVVTKKQHNNCIDPTAYVRFTRPFNLSPKLWWAAGYAGCRQLEIEERD